MIAESKLWVVNGPSDFRNARKVKPLLECSRTNFRGARKSRTVLLECSFSKISQMLECLYFVLASYISKANSTHKYIFFKIPFLSLNDHYVK